MTFTHDYISHFSSNFIARNSSCGKVMFSQAPVILSVGVGEYVIGPRGSSVCRGITRIHRLPSRPRPSHKADSRSH